MSVLDYCGKCNQPKQVKCPCGEPACNLVTYTRHCPACDPEAQAKYEKMHGVKVCDAYMRKQLGF